MGMGMEGLGRLDEGQSNGVRLRIVGCLDLPLWAVQDEDGMEGRMTF